MASEPPKLMERNGPVWVQIARLNMFSTTDALRSRFMGPYMIFKPGDCGEAAAGTALFFARLFLSKCHRGNMSQLSRGKQTTQHALFHGTARSKWITSLDMNLR
jgi:hypothetical protein